MLNHEMREWPRASSAVFFKVQDAFGGLSNMSNAFGLEIGDLRVGSSEALYQALKYPHLPNAQREILDWKGAFGAKLKAKVWRQRVRADWNEVRVEVMSWVIQVKLAQNPIMFSKALRETVRKGQPLAIVEQSRKDDFWGAKEVADEQGRVVLRGTNVLGQLLMELRSELEERGLEAMKVVPAPSFPDALLLERPLGAVRGR